MKKDRVIYYDILNIIAIISVIFLHHNASVHSDPNSANWTFSLFVECICYFAVPLFCMLSGANLMDYRSKYDTKTFFKKRFMKVLIPFISWSIILFIYKIFISKSLSDINSINKLLNGFFSNRQETTYYFMFSILGIYLTLPFLSLVAKKENFKILWFVVLLYFIFNSFLPNILSLFSVNYNNSTSVLLGGYTIYVLLGYLLSNTNIRKKHKIIIYIGTIIGIIYRYSVTYILSKEAGYVVKTVWNYCAWYNILLTSSVFLIIKDLFEKKIILNIKIKKIITSISSCSFGVYLIHMLIISFEIKIFNINTLYLEWKTLDVLLTYFFSLSIIYIMKKIPLVRKIVP